MVSESVAGGTNFELVSIYDNSKIVLFSLDGPVALSVTGIVEKRYKDQNKCHTMSRPRACNNQKRCV